MGVNAVQFCRETTFENNQSDKTFEVTLFIRHVNQGWHKMKPAQKKLPKKTNKTHFKKTLLSGLFWGLSYIDKLLLK